MNASAIFGFFRPSRTDFALLNAFLNASHWRAFARACTHKSPDRFPLWGKPGNKAGTVELSSV